MTATAEVIETDGTQTIRLPEGFRLETRTVAVRREGEAIVLEPLRAAIWPPGFFQQIRIDDPAFARSCPPASKSARLLPPNVPKSIDC